MHHYQVPSAEYSSYISSAISLGLAGDLIAQLHGSCSPDSPPSPERPLIKPADTCLELWMISRQCRSLPLVCTV